MIFNILSLYMGLSASDTNKKGKITIFLEE